MEMGGFGLLNELCYVVPCLFVYLNVNYKAGLPFLSFRAPPGLLRLDDSLVTSKGSWDGRERLSLFLVARHACLGDPEGSHCTDQEGHQHHRESLSQGGLSDISSEQWSVNAFNISAFHHLAGNPGPREVGSDRKQEAIRHVQVINIDRSYKRSRSTQNNV